MYPSRDPIDLTPLRPGVAPEDFADRREALAWFRAEHAVMISSVHRAEEAGADTHAWQLAWSLADYFNTQGHWSDAAAVWRVAAAAAHRSADHTVQARAHRLLASAYRQLGRHDDTEAELTIAFELCVAAGDELGQAHALNSLAYWCEQRRDYGAALEHSRRALAVYRNAGHRMGEATALNLVAWYHTLLGDHRPAIAHGEQALAMLRELDDRDGLAMTWDTVGYAHHHLGDHHRAVDYFRRAIAMHRDVGNRHPLPDIFVHLADALIALHDADAARTALHEALTILTELDHPDAAKVRAKLRDLDRGEGRPC